MISSVIIPLVGATAIAVALVFSWRRSYLRAVETYEGLTHNVVLVARGLSTVEEIDEHIIFKRRN